MSDILVLAEQFKRAAWRLNNLYVVSDKNGRKVPFRTNWAQQRFLEEMHLCNLVLKARQLGFTTFIQLFMLDEILFHSGIRAGVIAQSKDDARLIFRDKVKFPYENLPDQLRTARHVLSDTSDELLLSNNSSLRVGTSLRGGTLQLLHVSEFGKICAKFPEKAREIITGAFNTLSPGQMVNIESTAEGQEGGFFDMCQQARELQRRGRDLSPLDFKFHFFPWWEEPAYTMDPDGVEIPAALTRYFDELAAKHKIRLTARQQAWYAAKHVTQKGDMTREFPSTPDEAFAAAVEGAYYGDLLAQADADKRVTRVPHDPKFPVHVAFDLGLDDATAIWFCQRVGLEYRIIDYLEASGYELPWYVKELDKKPYRYGEIILPHDAEQREFSSGTSRRETFESLGLKRIRVNPQRPKEDSINGARNLIPKCVYDAEHCAAGLKALRNYRREWDDKLGTWRNRPLHNWASHGADAFAELAAADPQNDDPFSKPLKFNNRGIV
jgi:hypothetical protein